MIAKVLSTIAIAASVALATANPAGADPSVFAVLSCSCDAGPSFSVGDPTVRQQVDAGIENGLADLQSFLD
ncbi:hypothetical protein A5634_00405 [Mycobacterium asiaticum]|uniref:Uncharacterized protein n=1 Tax=Mycobacterium asiaticum TaxID=1790 RepID=A0A1A3NRJ6_MYCAS|nr:hypothetical protein [Mycobacterium asiaticum]OBK22947.1 hypothetical protein A5634_00405 [Mycobacterium asiaticum]